MERRALEDPADIFDPLFLSRSVNRYAHIAKSKKTAEGYLQRIPARRIEAHRLFPEALDAQSGASAAYRLVQLDTPQEPL